MALGTIVIGGTALAALGGLVGMFAGKEAGEIAGEIFNGIKNNIEDRKRSREAKKEAEKEAERKEASERAHEQRSKDLQERKAQAISTPATPPSTNGSIIPTIPQVNENGTTVQDTTNENVETSINASGINYEDIFKWQEEQQKKLWEREDAIRKETQQREDTAYQRAVEDMRKAGINPNLINVTPAESGGGITQATGIDMSLYKSELEKYLTELTTTINNEVKADENTKDRISDLISNAFSLFAIYGLSRKK